MRTLEQILKDKRDAQREVLAAQAKLERANSELMQLREAVLQAA